MRDFLISNIDVRAIIAQSKNILQKNGQFPTDCPKDTCLSLDRVTFNSQTVRVILAAQPPQLPTTKEWMNYENHPICNNRCGICGNVNRVFEITQNKTSGEVASAKGEWKSSIY